MSTHTPSEIPTLNNTDHIRRHIEDIDVQLLKNMAMSKAPLAYVVIYYVSVPAHKTEPFNDYNTVQQEMVVRMPHTHTAYCEGNIFVWEIIRYSIHNTEAFYWVNRFECCCYGCAAYIALTAHCLGTANNQALRSAADNQILNTFYGGENNRFN